MDLKTPILQKRAMGHGPCSKVYPPPATSDKAAEGPRNSETKLEHPPLRLRVESIQVVQLHTLGAWKPKNSECEVGADKYMKKYICTVDLYALFDGCLLLKGMSQTSQKLKNFRLQRYIENFEN